MYNTEIRNDDRILNSRNATVDKKHNSYKSALRSQEEVRGEVPAAGAHRRLQGELRHDPARGGRGGQGGPGQGAGRQPRQGGPRRVRHSPTTFNR